MQDLPTRPCSGLDTGQGPQRATATPLQIDISPDRAGCTVRLGGELDIATAAQLRGALQMVCTGEYRLVTVDLGDLSFLSLAGLRVLAAAQETLQVSGCRLVLSRPDTLTVRVLAITGFDRFLNLSPETDRAGPACSCTCSE